MSRYKMFSAEQLRLFKQMVALPMIPATGAFDTAIDGLKADDVWTNFTPESSDNDENHRSA